jgi:hypothetical protein
VKIWGLSLAQMNAYSSTFAQGVAIENYSLTIEAGDLGSNLSTLIEGLIWSSFIDLTDAPDVCFNVTMSGLYLGANPIAAQSAPPKIPGTPSAHDAETLIASLCAAAGLTFSNPSGAHQVLRNQSTYGSVLDQIDQVADAAKFSWTLKGSTVLIWPRGGTADNVVIDVGPGTTPRMVGYVALWRRF